MVVESFNDIVFGDIKKMVEEKYANDVNYINAVIVLGYQIAPFTYAQYKSKHPRERVIVYQMEQLFKGSKWLNRHTLDWLKQADEVWDYDLENIQMLSMYGVKAQYKPMVYTNALKYTLPQVEKDIDVLFYGCMTNRRVMLLQAWTSMSMYHATTFIATGLTDKKLADYINRSKVILNLHAYNGVNRQEQARIFMPVINGACVVSERSVRNEFGTAIVECDSKNINVTVKNLLKTGDWAKVGIDAPEIYRRICEARNY